MAWASFPDPAIPIGSNVLLSDNILQCNPRARTPRKNPAGFCYSIFIIRVIFYPVQGNSKNWRL
jgi:hypothetical protein